MMIKVVSQCESSDAALTTEFGNFRKSLTTFMAELGHFGLDRCLNRRNPIPCHILIETASHVIGAASMT